MSKMKKLLRILLPSTFITLQACVPLVRNDFDSNQKVMALIDQGTLALREQKFKEAKGSFEAALEIKTNAAALDGIGCVAFAEGDYKAAEDYFIRARKQDPKYYNALSNLALLYERLGHQQAAYELYQLSISYQPENYRARNNFAAYLYDYNRVADAKSELYRALALAKHPTVRENLREIGNYE